MLNICLGKIRQFFLITVIKLSSLEFNTFKAVTNGFQGRSVTEVDLETNEDYAVSEK